MNATLLTSLLGRSCRILRLSDKPPTLGGSRYEPAEPYVIVAVWADGGDLKLALEPTSDVGGCKEALFSSVKLDKLNC